MTKLSRVHNTEDLEEFIEQTSDIILDYKKDDLVKAYVDDNLSEELNLSAHEEADQAVGQLHSMKIIGRLYEILENTEHGIRDEKGVGDTIRNRLQYVIYKEIESRIFYKVEQKIENLPEEELTAQAL